MPTQTTVNGLPALWVDGPAPYTAALVVRAGAVDETIRTTGVAHLVEHLVMAAQPRTALDVNASVEDVVTVFHATGPREAVAAWLGGVCAAARSLPVDRLAVEARVLDAEGGDAAAPALLWAAGSRYGAGGTGMLGREGAPHRTLTAEHVHDFVERHYTSANAVVVATGPPPEHPDLHLPEGPRPQRLPARPTPLVLPAYLSGPPVPVASWLVERSASAGVLFGLVSDLVTDGLRHREGLVYEVGTESTPVDLHTGLGVLWTDGSEEDQPRILRHVVEVLRRLATDGPTETDLAHQKAVARAQLTDPRATVDYLEFCAARFLEDRPVPSVEEVAAETEAVAPQEVRRAAARALDTLLIGGTEPAEEGIAGIPDRTDDEVPDAPVLEGRQWRRRLVSLAPWDLRVVIGEDGLTQTVLGHRLGGRWTDLCGVARGPDFRALVFRDGMQLVVWPRDLKDGGAAVAEIDRRAGGLLFEVDEGWLDG